MPEEKRRISPAVAIGVGIVGLGLAVVIGFAAKAKAAPPEEYPCPYCEATFTSYEELAAHVQSVHPGERIPLPIEWE